MIGIIGAMEKETSQLKAMLSDVHTQVISGIEFVDGTLFSQRVVVATCGVGKVFAAICAEAMILRYAPELIINTGVAGSLTSALGITDIAIADAVVQHDMDTTPLGDPKGLLSGINIVNIPTSQKAVDLLKNCIEALGIHTVIGKIASGDQFVDSRQAKNKIAEEFSAIACEMEGASIGHVCYVNEVEFVVLRAISDSFDDESSLDYAKFVTIAAEQAVRVLCEFLKSY